MQSWKTSMKRALKHVGFSTLTIGILAGCNYADLRPKTDVDSSVVTRSVTPAVTAIAPAVAAPVVSQIIPEITPDFEPDVAVALPLTQPDNIEDFIAGPKISKRVPDRLVGVAKNMTPRVVRPVTKKPEKKGSSSLIF